ncbi:hypothetical protein EJ05DRAFT_340835 [Pseudovirgaria hyperparasitica]|uniref:Uncharacterized protein n=1 Tax=Pseudovirgaria hyperparasitica TaxID=470096 RepID=A0A6A6WAT6_9PEZI|nr:uncharacterized protein EJ05DRAFT_340835 [Pseudovirgaria hyperparasitica]KAF2759289.1 hypothetical protein EJ05DRAFT_340835 [Pseudovirgaria hyperparasitica]
MPPYRRTEKGTNWQRLSIPLTHRCNFLYSSVMDMYLFVSVGFLFANMRVWAVGSGIGEWKWGVGVGLGSGIGKWD